MYHFEHIELNRETWLAIVNGDIGPCGYRIAKMLWDGSDEVLDEAHAICSELNKLLENQSSMQKMLSE